MLEGGAVIDRHMYETEDRFTGEAGLPPVSGG